MVKTVTCSRVIPSFLAKAVLKTSSQSKCLFSLFSRRDFHSIPLLPDDEIGNGKNFDRPYNTPFKQLWIYSSGLNNLYKPTYICPNSQKHARIDSKTVPPARSPLTTPLARRLAPHACTWRGPLQQGAMSTRKPQTRLNNWVKFPETQLISRLFNTENSKCGKLGVSVQDTLPFPLRLTAGR